MDFNFQCRVTYENGQTYERQHMLIIQIGIDEYKKIVLGVLDGKEIKEVDGITGVIEEMTETFLEFDRWTNMDGSNRKEPLKIRRAISAIEFYMPLSDYQRFKKIKNPFEVLERPEEHMTIYRSDGSSVKFISTFGQIKVLDSRQPNCSKVLDADVFLAKI